MTLVGDPVVRVHACGQEVQVQEVNNGYLLYPKFMVNGEWMNRCPQCGGRLRSDRLNPSVEIKKEAGNGT